MTDPATTSSEVDLEEVSIAQLLFELMRERFEGSLVLTQEAPVSGRRQVWFRGGLPVFTDWVDPPSEFHNLLAESGFDATVLQSAVETARTQNTHVGNVLLAGGHLDRGRLAQYLRAETERKLVAAFALRSGTATLEAKEHSVGAQLGQINALNVILHGVAHHYDEDRIIDEIGDDLFAPVYASEDFERYRSQFGFSRDDERVLSMLRQGTRLSALRRIKSVNSERAAQVIYTLWATCMLETDGRGSSPGRQSVEQIEQEKNLRGQLSEVEALIRSGAAATIILGITEDMSPVAKRNAYQSRLLDTSQLAALGIVHIRPRVERYNAWLTKAYTLLSEQPRAREAQAPKAAVLTAQYEQGGGETSAAQPASEASASTSGARRRAATSFLKAQMERDPKALLRMAEKYELAGQWETAKGYLEKVLAIPKNPHIDAAKASMIWIDFQLSGRDDDDAMRNLIRVQELARDGHDTANARYYIGMLMLEQGKSGPAIAAFKDALELDKHHERSQRQLHIARQERRRKTLDDQDSSKGGLFKGLLGRSSS